jgi:membrane protein
MTEDEIAERAGSVAYSFTLAIFPAIIFLFTLIPYIKPLPGLEGRIFELLAEWMPPAMYEITEHTIRDIISRPRGGLLSFGVIFALYLATNGILSLMKAFNAVYHIKEKRSYIRTHVTSLLLTIMLAFVLILAVVLLFVGQIVIKEVDNLGLITDDIIVYLFIAVRFVVMFIVFQIAISSVYYFAPAVQRKWSFFSIGSIIATFLTLGISYLFSFYLSNFGTYNKLYGSIGALIGLMVWFFIISIILLVGYEVNVSIEKSIEDNTKPLESEEVELQQVGT